MSALYFLNMASIRICLGFLSGLVIFISSEIIPSEKISLLINRAFNYFVLSPSAMALSIALVCFLVLAKTEIDVKKIGLEDSTLKNRVAVFLEHAIYFKAFFTYSAILGYSIALNIKHEMNKGFFHIELLKTTLVIYVSLIIITPSIALIVKQYSSDKENNYMLALTRYSLIVAGSIFISLMIYY